MAETRRLIRFTLNDRETTAEVDTHHNLVELLNQFDLCGARESCGQGLCGCCTVMVDGQAVSGCLYFAPFADGRNIRTVEYLDRSGELDPIQAAFIECGAFQCGFCTPGFAQMVQHLLERNPDPDDDEIKDFLSGNLCRCATYPEIIQAVHLAVQKRRAMS